MLIFNVCFGVAFLIWLMAMVNTALLLYVRFKMIFTYGDDLKKIMKLKTILLKH